MNYATLNKTQLLQEVTKLSNQLTQTQQQASNALQLANYFNFNLERIEQLLLNSPIGKGKFVRTLWFLITNSSVILELLIQLKAIIEEWRAKIEELKASQNVKQD